MPFSAAVSVDVKQLLRAFMENWLAKQYAEIRAIREEGVSPKGVLAPFHDALVPGIRGLGERGFSTALGNLHERIALVVASEVHAVAERAVDLTGQLPVLAREFITQRLGQLEAGAAEPDHEFEREQLLNAFGTEVTAVTRIDLAITTHDDDTHYFEMKSAKPNKGQCIEMKQRLLTAVAIRRSARVWAWWGVPYNPYGIARAYGHPYPKRFFDFTRDVKLGADFWNFVGDDATTFDDLLALYREIGTEFSEQLDALRAELAGRDV
jgi:hypothetical protein